MTDLVAMPPDTRPGPRAVRVWDLGVRVFHWSLAALFLAEFAILEEDSPLHRWAGYAIVGLICLRLIWGLVGTRYARFSTFPPNLRAARDHMREILRGEKGEVHLSHNPLGALMVYNLLVTLILAGVTGHMMGMDAYWGIQWIGLAHAGLVNWAVLSIILHVGGVAVEGRRSKVSLVRAMFTGWKSLPDDRD